MFAFFVCQSFTKDSQCVALMALVQNPRNTRHHGKSHPSTALCKAKCLTVFAEKATLISKTKAKKKNFFNQLKRHIARLWNEKPCSWPTWNQIFLHFIAGISFLNGLVEMRICLKMGQMIWKHADNKQLNFLHNLNNTCTILWGVTKLALELTTNWCGFVRLKSKLICFPQGSKEKRGSSRLPTLWCYLLGRMLPSIINLCCKVEVRHHLTPVQQAHLSCLNLRWPTPHGCTCVCRTST